MNIFLMGGRGFVGSAFARVCAARGITCSVIDRQTYTHYVGRSCDVLINAAGNARKHFSREDPIADFDASVRGVRASLVDFKFGRYVLISSADVYMDCSSSATTSEDQVIDAAGQTPYGFHKHLAELCVQHAAREWLIVRCGGFVGPGLRKNPIFDILHGHPLWMTPDSQLQYIHTDTAASIVLSLLQRNVLGSALNLCGRGVVELAQVMRWARKTVPVQPGSRFFRCELNLDRVSSLVDLPETSDTVREFVT